MSKPEDRMRGVLERLVCDCNGRCERMEWMPADNGVCVNRAARAALIEGKQHG